MLKTSTSPASSCGEPTMSASQPLIAVAGPVVNDVVGYYELTTAPLYYNVQTGCIVRRDTGANVDCSTPTVKNDVFVMETFTDSAGRSVFIIYGRQWGGNPRRLRICGEHCAEESVKLHFLLVCVQVAGRNLRPQRQRHTRPRRHIHANRLRLVIAARACTYPENFPILRKTN
jgi:hypothetical protein